MNLPHPYKAIDEKVINTKTGRTLKPSSQGSYKLKGKYYQHKQIFNLDRLQRFGDILKFENGEIYISKGEAMRKTGIHQQKLHRLIDEGKIQVL